MAECIIARGGGRSDGSNSGLPPVVADRCSILVTVKDSAGTIINDLSVHCRDGSTWYNYHTNEKGQVLFMTNSGSANITAWNFSLNGNYKWIDQVSATQNVDALVGTSKAINLNLTKQTNQVTVPYPISSNIYFNNFSGNCRTRVSTRVKLFLGAGGGGGYGYNNSRDVYYGSGGGGGGCIVRNNYTISSNRDYKFYVGAGGRGGYGSSVGLSGGSTSGFGLSASGGGGGGIWHNEGAGGSGDYNGGNGGASYGMSGTDSEYSGWGGGGAGNADTSAVNGGSPGGGRSSMGQGYDGSSGGGGGACGRRSGRNNSGNGGDGGEGVIRYTFL